MSGIFEEYLKKWCFILGGKFDFDGEVDMGEEFWGMSNMFDVFYDSEKKGGLGVLVFNVNCWFGDICCYFFFFVV